MKANFMQMLLVQVQDTPSCCKPESGTRRRADPRCPSRAPAGLKATQLPEGRERPSDGKAEGEKMTREMVSFATNLVLTEGELSSFALLRSRSAQSRWVPPQYGTGVFAEGRLGEMEMETRMRHCGLGRFFPWVPAPVPSLGAPGSPRTRAGGLPMTRQRGTSEPLLPPLPPAAFSSPPALSPQHQWSPTPSPANPWPPALPFQCSPLPQRAPKGCWWQRAAYDELCPATQHVPDTTLGTQIETAQLIAAVTRARSWQQAPRARVLPGANSYIEKMAIFGGAGTASGATQGG